jgi:hypothetical protein
MSKELCVLSILCALCVICGSCSDDDSAGSANVGLGIKVFFPTKVVTNQPITINGSGFNGVTEIQFPGGARVTDFEIVSDDMIRVNAPSGIPAEGGKIVVRTANDEAESRLSLTVGHTNVTGFSKQSGESATGGELITVYGTDLEFINSVELLNAEGLPQLVDHKDFYRKGTTNLIFRVPQRDIFKGTFVGILHTYDGQSIPMPELAYEPGAQEGHWETVITPIWENDGSLGAINWSSDYRFAPESNSTGEECYTVPQDIWEKMKTGPFYMKFKIDDPSWYQIRITTGWWGVQWPAGKEEDITPNFMSDMVIDNGDGTYYIELNLAGSDLAADMDAQHLLFTGSGYTPLSLYFAEDVWVDGGGGHSEIVKTSVWKNDGSLGAINWSSDYRFAPESNSTGEECYTVPQDIWEKMKTEPFYMQFKIEDPSWYQIRITTGWWGVQWPAGKEEDITPNFMSDMVIDNGDGTYYIELNLAGSDLAADMDAQHLLFTGSGYTPLEIYFAEEVWVDGGGESAQEITIWENGGSLGSINWSSDYRFAPESNSTGEECYTVPQDVWDKMKTGPFYMQFQIDTPDWYQIRITTGWWGVQWPAGKEEDITPNFMSDMVIDNGDGTYYIELNLAGSDLAADMDAQHLLFTGSGYTPLKLYFK